MKFANIQILFLLWTAPVLVLVLWYGRRKRGKILDAFADRRVLAGLLPGGVTARRNIRAVLMICAVLMLVVAMAGPQYGFQWQEMHRRGVDLIIALDCSRSMLAQDIRPNRLARAKREIVDLLNMLGGDRVGLVAFSGTAFVQCPLTMDYSAFDLFLNVLTPDYLPVGGTDLDAAVRTALSGFDPRSTADKAIILITDGEHTGRGDPEAAAAAAQKQGVKLFCIGVGSAEGVPVPSREGGFQKDAAGKIVLSRLDETQLTRMAVATGGTYARSVAGDMDLDAIYRDQIRGGMTTAELEGGRRQVWANRFQWPLTVCFFLLLAAFGVPEVKKPLLRLMTLMAALLMWLPTAQAGPLQQGYKAYQEKDYKSALQHFIDAQVAKPDDPQLLYNLGNAYYKTGDFDAAEAHYGQALGQADPSLKSKLLYNLGNTAFRKGEAENAVKNYQAALKMNPDDKQAKENLDFVKKMLEQQQQKQQQNNQQQQSEQEQQKQSDNQKQQEQQSDKREQESSPKQSEQQQSGQDKQQQSAPDQKEQSGGSDKEHPSPPSEAQESEQAGGKMDDAGQQQPDQGQLSQQAADNMLDRLKDEPGRAMMPRYGQHQTDKDW